MATFEAKVHRLKIEPHPDADLLELAAIGGFRSIVGKGTYETGDLAAYIPEAAVCPDWVIEDLGLEGKLAGKQRNRVKAIRLRGVLSQGLVYPVKEGRIRGRAVAEGDDVTALLEIVKWVPPVPVQMAGQMEPALEAKFRYEIEDIKRYPDVLVDGEPVVMTEKLHGTWTCFGFHPEHGPVVASKGFAEQGLRFKLGEENKDNLYVKMFHAKREAWDTLRAKLAPNDEPFFVLGEIHGRKIQDLQYDLPEPRIRMFDVCIGAGAERRYLNPDELAGALEGLFDAVPRVYAGPYSAEAVAKHTDGQTTLEADHLREGIVIRPAMERRERDIGRVIVKSISERYLTRRGGTEYV